MTDWNVKFKKGWKVKKICNFSCQRIESNFIYETANSSEKIKCRHFRNKKGSSAHHIRKNEQLTHLMNRVHIYKRVFSVENS